MGIINGFDFDDRGAWIVPTVNVDIKFLRDSGNLPADETESEQIVASLSVDEIQETSGSGPSKDGKYVVHPAFKWGAENTEVSGIWVAKFEASHSDARIDESDNMIEGTSSTLKVVPNVTSWRNIDTITIYKTCIDYDKNVLNNESLNSHMMKNIEWGAILFLSYSKYGLDGREVGLNQCGDFVTGAGPRQDGVEDSYNVYSYKEKKDEFKSIYGYSGTEGKKASTTDNVYGVYDMKGGAYEKVAGFVVGDDSDLSDWLAGGDVEDYTVDIYEGSPTNGDDASESKINYELTKEKYGDGVWECSAFSEKITEYLGSAARDLVFCFRGLGFFFELCTVWVTSMLYERSASTEH